MKDCEKELRPDSGPATGVEQKELPDLARLLSKLDILERDKARLTAELEVAQKHEALSVLARGIAHDMNNILGSIMGLASIMRMDSELSGQVLDDLDAMVSACSRGRVLTQNLSELARDTGHLDVSFSLNTLLVDVVGELRKKTSNRPRARIALDLIDDDTTVSGDQKQLRQVFYNLLGNSLDATPDHGQIFVTTSDTELIGRDLVGHPKLKPGRYVRCSITDTGAGMDDETLKSACKPFFTTKADEGAGLGLAFVYGVIRNHGGRLTITSAPGEGTAVTIELAHSDEAPPPSTTSAKA